MDMRASSFKIIVIADGMPIGSRLIPIHFALGRPHAAAMLGLSFNTAVRMPKADIRLFGKPESFVKRRMGVALAFDADAEVARTNAKKAAALVKPRAA